MPTTITKLFSTGVLNSGVPLDEITYSSIKVSPTGVYAAQFDEVSYSSNAGVNQVGFNGVNTTKNKFTYTQDFSNSAWGRQQLSNSIDVTLNATAAPDGSLTANKIARSATGGTFYSIFQGVTASASTNYSYSIFAKVADGGNAINLYVFTGTTNQSTGFNLSTGTTTGSYAPDSNFTINSSLITNYGNGWYRISFNFIHSVGGSFQFKYDVPTAGVGTGVYMWGAQLEQSLTPTAYVGMLGSGININNFISRDGSTGIKYVAGSFDEYTPIAPDGLTAATASTSAYAIKQAYPASTDGRYWIQNANINGGAAVQVYCDMTTLGGGWTLIMQNNYGDWSFANALLRNQTSAPSALAANNTSGTAGSNGNYSIIGWADYIKKSASGFDYMLDAGYRGRNGGAWTANQAYSFTGQVDNTAYNAQGGTQYFGGGGNVISGSAGFRQDITSISFFNIGASGSGTWGYNDSGLEKRMPWYANNAASPGNSFVGGAIFTTTHDDGGSWWGTLMSNGGGWDPAPWQADTSNGYPKVIWYWVR